MEPLTIEVITYAPSVFSHCQHCEVAFREIGVGERFRRQQAAEALPDDLARDYQSLSDWVHGLLERHGGAIRVRVIDAASIEGFLHSLRHGAWSHPAVIVDGRRVPVAGDYRQLDPVIEGRLASMAR